MHDPASPVSLERINEMTDGDVEFLSEIVSLFLEDTATLVTELSASVQADDAGAVRIVAHKIKGSALNMGVAEVATCAKALEDLAKAGVCGPAGRTALDTLVHEMERARIAFEAILKDAA